MNILFTCGGTAGHINPAAALARLFQEREPECKVLFVGADGGMETRLVPKEGFEIETEMSIHAADKRMQVSNVVIDYRDRPEGSVSKLNTFSDGFRVLARILSLYKNYKPFQFFSLLSVVLTVLGVGFLIPILTEYFRTSLVPRFPTLIVCCFVLVAALQSFFAGLVLQSMEQKNKQDFEMQLLQARNVYESLRKQ